MEVSYKTHGDAMRQLLELAITCGRCWQSSQTEYIHYCYTIRDEIHHQPIPTYENFLFILALMRSRSIENINEAKTLLSRLLYFQSSEGEMSGNFPIYLHEYPFCKDRLWGVHLLAPLHWIYKNFHHVLGVEIKQSLKVSLVKLLDYCLKANNEKRAPYLLELQIAACAKSIGILLNQNGLIASGEQLWQQLQTKPDLKTWNTPSGLSSLIVAYQMIYPSFEHSPEKEFWRHLTVTWHPGLNAYCGPGWKEYQEGYEPQVTLYDYFMGYLSGNYSHRCFVDHPVQLQAALLHPTEDTLPIFEMPAISSGILEGLSWQILRDTNLTYSCLSKDTAIIPLQDKTFASLKILWGTFQRLHSFICQGSTASKIEVTSSSESLIELIFTFTEPAQVDDEDKCQEISFYVDEHVSMNISVDGIAATTFKIEDKLFFSDDHLKLVLSFHLESGKGEFFGHLMKSNRPSQLLRIGKNRFSIFDRQIFLRTIHRSNSCVIKARLEILRSLF